MYAVVRESESMLARKTRWRAVPNRTEGPLAPFRELRRCFDDSDVLAADNPTTALNDAAASRIARGTVVESNLVLTCARKLNAGARIYLSSTLPVGSFLGLLVVWELAIDSRLAKDARQLGQEFLLRPALQCICSACY